MVNRTLRRPKPDGIENRIIVTGSDGNGADGSGNNADESVIIAGTESTTDGVTTDDTNESNEPVRNGVVEIDPGDIDTFIAGGGSRTDTSSGDGDTTGRRTRADKGTKRGKRTGKREAPKTVEPLIMMAHTWAAVLLKTPELNITDAEAKQLSDSYCEFCKYHEVPLLTPKRQSEINLLIAVCVVEGSRLITIAKKSRKGKLKLVPMVQPQSAS